MGNYKLYAPNEAGWRCLCDENLYNKTLPEVKTYDNVLVEPLKRITTAATADITYSGGVCYEDGVFIAGLKRSVNHPKMNFSVYESYLPKPNSDIKCLSGDYVFGGVIIHIFGHIITDSLTRLWYLAKNQDDSRKVIFVSTTPEIPNAFWTVIDMLGIGKERIIIADRIYKCEKLTVPEQSFLLYGYYTDEFLTAYRAIGSRALSSASEGKNYPKKIYLTRTRLAKKDCFGEEYFESFYKSHGYEIIAPEQHSFDEQIKILANAEEIVSTLGTLTHLVLFVPDKPKLTVLLRTNEIGAAKQQIMMNSAMDIDYEIIDVSMGLLPTTHAAGVFLMGPTKHWKRYLDESGFTYSEDELKMDWSCVHDYLVEYTRIYTKYAYPYKRVQNTDIFDVINRMSNVFFGESLDREKMHTESKDSVMKRLRETEQKLGVLEKQRVTFVQFLAAVKPYEKKLSVVSVKSDKPSVNGNEPDVKKYAAKAHKKYGLSESADKLILNFAYAAILCEKNGLVSFADGAELLSESEAAKFKNSAYDVLLFKKTSFVRTVADQYKDTHGEESYKAMTSAISSVCPEYYSSARVILSAHQLIMKNSFVMTSEAYADYSGWIIPLLADIEKKLSAKDKALLPKIAERLQTVYFIHNKDKYNIAFFE